MKCHYNINMVSNDYSVELKDIIKSCLKVDRKDRITLDKLLNKNAIQKKASELKINISSKFIAKDNQPGDIAGNSINSIADSVCRVFIELCEYTD